MPASPRAFSRYWGKPLLCVPFFPDQSAVARDVAAAGAGLVIDAAAATRARVRDAVKRLRTDQSFGRNAARRANALRATGGVTAAAAAVEAWAGYNKQAAAKKSDKRKRLAPPPPPTCRGDDAAPWHRATGADRAVVAVAICVLSGLGVGRVVFGEF